jgi:hypothetical protein
MIKALGIAFRRYGAMCALAIAAVAVVPSAHADPMLLASGSSLANGPQSWTSGIEVTGAGRLTVQVSDLGVPLTIVERLQSLSFSISNSTSVLNSYLGEGVMSLDIKDPGLLFLNISAIPSVNSQFGNLRFGLVSWNATFDPVPLPASLWLLIAGAAWATGLQRKRAKVASNESSGFLPWRTGPALAH